MRRGSICSIGLATILLVLAGVAFFSARWLPTAVEGPVLLVALAFLGGALALAVSIVRAHLHDVKYGPPPGQVVEIPPRPVAPAPHPIFPSPSEIESATASPSGKALPEPVREP